MHLHEHQGGTMLEQYQKEFSQKHTDLLSEDSDLEKGLSKRKLFFALSGATFALVFFLFLMFALDSQGISGNGNIHFLRLKSR